MIQATMKIGFPATEALDIYGRLGGAYAWTDSSISAWANDGTSNLSASGGGKYHGAAFVGALGMNLPSTRIGPPASNTSTPRRSARTRWMNPA